MVVVVVVVDLPVVLLLIVLVWFTYGNAARLRYRRNISVWIRYDKQSLRGESVSTILSNTRNGFTLLFCNYVFGSLEQ